MDVPDCYHSDFDVLALPTNNGTHCRAYTLDSAGKQKALALARSVGTCSTCSGGGTQQEGFQATIVGTLGSGDPPLLAVRLMFNATVGCDAYGGVSTPASLDCKQGVDQSWILAHGSIMMFSWGLLLPSGVITARLFKHRPNALWFRSHRIMQCLGLCFAIAGWSIALARFDALEVGKGTSFTHGVCGMIVMTLGLLQPINAYFRPHNPEPGQELPFIRRAWEWLHKGSGYTAVLLAIVTISLGTTRVPKKAQQQAFQAVYGCIFFFLVCLIAGMIWDKRSYQEDLEQVSSMKLASVEDASAEAAASESHGAE